MDDNDLVLVSRCLMGDTAAYGALYAARARGVMAYFRRSGFDQAQAEDLTQDTFIRAFKSLGTFDAQKGYFNQWMAAIARNVARKKWELSKGGGELYDPQLAEMTLASAEEDPSAALQRQEDLDALAECVAGLSEDYRRIIRLRYVEAMTTRGIAQATDMPESTVRLRLNDARDRLAKCLRGKGITP